MNVYEALMRDGKEKRERLETAVAAQREKLETDPGSPVFDGADAWNAQKAGLPTTADLTAMLSGPYYMDPPDGGSVTLLEQLQRMAKDAARYRWLSARMLAADFNYNESGIQALVFEMPRKWQASADCNETIAFAMALGGLKA